MMIFEDSKIPDPARAAALLGHFLFSATLHHVNWGHKCMSSLEVLIAS